MAGQARLKALTAAPAKKINMKHTHTSHKHRLRNWIKSSHSIPLLKVLTDLKSMSAGYFIQGGSMVSISITEIVTVEYPHKTDRAKIL